MEDTEEYLDRLRAVFELFDTEKRGFITVDHFVDLAQEHFGAEESQSQVCYFFNCSYISSYHEFKVFNKTLFSIQ